MTAPERLDVTVFTEETKRNLKQIASAARTAARDVAALLELKQRAKEHGIQFVEVKTEEMIQSDGNEGNKEDSANNDQHNT